mmetsp:Transcript_11958/g.34101  ORF Transcript_11958/g.34101 Transcript_11958/m.34101 type:complete len:229 (+) Transcript_11958:343-1029(+)
MKSSRGPTSGFGESHASLGAPGKTFGSLILPGQVVCKRSLPGDPDVIKTVVISLPMISALASRPAACVFTLNSRCLPPGLRRLAAQVPSPGCCARQRSGNTSQTCRRVLGSLAPLAGDARAGDDKLAGEPSEATPAAFARPTAAVSAAAGEVQVARRKFAAVSSDGWSNSLRLRTHASNSWGVCAWKLQVLQPLCTRKPLPMCSTLRRSASGIVNCGLRPWTTSRGRL